MHARNLPTLFAMIAFFKFTILSKPKVSLGFHDTASPWMNCIAFGLLRAGTSAMAAILKVRATPRQVHLAKFTNNFHPFPQRKPDTFVWLSSFSNHQFYCYQP
jgi:hypothetical protein